MRIFIILVIGSIANVTAIAQVKPQYLYNTNMPYGTLDIRTEISSTNYYYLQEGSTFSFRESAPATKTNTYLNMTPWDSSPYKEGNMRRKVDDKDYFILNYRLLLPTNYNASYQEGYPLIVIMHGAIERGNCYYNDCYHSSPEYNPNTNLPVAPTTADHKLLNNDHHLSMGGKEHLAARNLAGALLPNDPNMPGRAFPGFVLFAQMLNGWDSLNIEDVIRLVRLHCKNYSIDQNRIYIHGLSIGGYATYEAIKRASWLFAAALPMSSVTEAANIFKHNQQNKVAHIPIWIFQGGVDKEPTPEFTNNLINKFKAAGAIVKYTVYPNLGHNVWNTAYNEPTFFSWMASQNKANFHIPNGNRVIDKAKNVFPELVLAEGFLAYQWEKDGAIISDAKSHSYTVKAPGTYRARFSRISPSPTDSQWNRWSESVVITGDADDNPVTSLPDDKQKLSVSVYPNPSRSDNLQIEINGEPRNHLEITLHDSLGKKFCSVVCNDVDLYNCKILNLSSVSDGVYILTISNGQTQYKQRVVISNR